MPNILVSTNTASAPSNVLVGATSGVVLAQNLNRAGLILTNLSTGTVYLAFDGGTAVLVSGVTLGANGGVFSMDDFNFTKGAINGIAHSAGAIVAIQQFYIGT